MLSLCLHIFFNQKSTERSGQTSRKGLVQIPDFYAQSSKYFVLILLLHILTYYSAILSKVFPTLELFSIVVFFPSNIFFQYYLSFYYFGNFSDFIFSSKYFRHTEMTYVHYNALILYACYEIDDEW
jgi:hypothetical protein